jgi:amino acid transporter
MATTATAATHPGLSRRLGFWSSIGFVIGMTIGSGIFRTPAVVAARAGAPLPALFVWVVGGLVTMCGALSVAALATSSTDTGGIYAYLRDGWGRAPAFVFAWAELVLISSAGVAGIAAVFGEYALRSFGYDPAAYPHGAQYVAATAIAITTVANVRGVRVGAAVTGLSTIAKFSALAFLVGASLVLGGRAGASTLHFASSPATAHPGLFGLAFISVLWAYDGFADLPFIAGEVVDAERTVPRAIIMGTLAIIGIYLAANAAYLYVLPIDRVVVSPLIAADAMNALFGTRAAGFVAVAVMLSTLGAVNSHMLGIPRIFFAAGHDGIFFSGLARVHPRYRTPYVSIMLIGAMGIAFELLGTFEQLADTFILAIWPFYGLAVASLYKRRQGADARQHRVPGYPIVPGIFIGACVYLVGSALLADPVWTSVTFAIVLAGAPVYYVMFGRRREQIPPPAV